VTINELPIVLQRNMGSGTDVAISSGHITLMKSDLRYVISAGKLE
jgi:cation transport ATPase